MTCHYKFFKNEPNYQVKTSACFYKSFIYKRDMVTDLDVVCYCVCAVSLK
jgi:hypothetical protein